MTQPRVDNDTPFLAEPHLLCDKDGDKLCAVVKATFEHVPGPPQGDDGTFAPAPPFRRRPIRGADVPWGKPEIASIRYPSDLCVRKPGTDVVVVACAWAPGGEPAPRFEAGVRLGKVTKVVWVTGPRVWLPYGDGVSEPRPTESVVLRYDFAFGGFDATDPKKPVEEPRNPVGRGIAADTSKLEGSAAPQIEDPLEPVRSAAARPKPAGLCAIGRHYEPRRARWGTYDAAWLEKRAPLLPPDFDDRANLCATPELVAVPPMHGGEEGAVTNLTPGGGALPLMLPRVRLSIEMRVKGREPVVLRPYIDTVIIDTLGPIELRELAKSDPDAPLPPKTALVLELVWRAFVPAPRKLADAEIVVREGGLS